MNLKYEKALIENGCEYIAGVDEVGRGALAGPMVVAAVVLRKESIKKLLEFEKQGKLTNNDVKDTEIKLFTQIKDSKQLTDKKRRELSQIIRSECISYSIIEISPDKLDRIGISKATQYGFYNSIKKLKVTPNHILTDAFSIHSINKDLQTNIKFGDKLSISISAASIVAKVYRDDLMIELHNSCNEYKMYHFDENKAYGTKKHLEALNKFGPSSIHRKSFEPVKSMYKDQRLN
jgi:ribonuclease HII